MSQPMGLRVSTVPESQTNDKDKAAREAGLKHHEEFVAFATQPELRTLEYYKEVAKLNPKWLGVQAKELLIHYATLEDRCEQWLAEAQDNHDPQVRAMTKIENRLMDSQAEVGRLEGSLERLSALCRERLVGSPEDGDYVMINVKALKEALDA